MPRAAAAAPRRHPRGKPQRACSVRAWRTKRRSTLRACGAALTLRDTCFAQRPSRGQRVVPRTHVAAHVGAAEFGMELHAPDAIAPAERVAGVLRRPRQHGRAVGRAQHGLQVRGLRREPQRQAGEQRIVVRPADAARGRSCPSRARPGCRRPRRRARARATGGRSRCRTAAGPRARPRAASRRVRSLQSWRSVTIAAEPVTIDAGEALSRAAAHRRARRSPPPRRRVRARRRRGSSAGSCRGGASRRPAGRFRGSGRAASRAATLELGKPVKPAADRGLARYTSPLYPRPESRPASHDRPDVPGITFQS